MFLNRGSKFRCLTSLPRLLRVIKFADFTGTIKALRLPTIHLAALRFPSLGDTLVVCDGFERRLLTHERRPELVTRLPSPTGLYKEIAGSPKFL